MKYLAFTIIFLASCFPKSDITRIPESEPIEQGTPVPFNRYEVTEGGNKYVIYVLPQSSNIVEVTKDSLTTELLKQTLERNEQP